MRTAALLVGLLGISSGLAAQSRAGVLRERAEYEAWLRQSPDSPIHASWRATAPLAWYPYDPGLVFLAPVLPPRDTGVISIVADEGDRIAVTPVGTFTIAVGGQVSRLAVWRLPAIGEARPAFEVHFADSTSGTETHRAGRFVPLIDLGGGRFLLDLNRARHPFCAYDPPRPCPPASQASVIDAPIRAGERAPLYP